MKIKRMSIVTLGVKNLKRATAFYRHVLKTRPTTSYPGVTFFQLPGVWISLFPLQHLAKDISPALRARRGPFSGVTLAHNTRSKKEVVDVVERARRAGARVLKKPSDTFWGGFSGYFEDPDGFIWEIAWGPMFGFKKDGTLAFRKTQAR